MLMLLLSRKLRSDEHDTFKNYLALIYRGPRNPSLDDNIINATFFLDNFMNSDNNYFDSSSIAKLRE